MNTAHLNFSKEHNVIKETIIEGGKIALKWFNNKPNVWKKEDGTDVSEADIEIDNFLQVELKKKIPNTGWLSEENKDDYSRLDYEKTLIVDPIDGTKSFLTGKKDFCIAIALIKHGRPISAVIYNPINEELFEAEKNKGSWLNSKKIRTTKTSKLENSKMCAFKPMISAITNATPALFAKPVKLINKSSVL